MTDTSSLGYYSRLFLVPKPDGSFRPIIDLMKLNLFLEIPSFNVETLFSLIAALQPQEWITKIDLKDAYHHILVHVNIRKYFRFFIAGKTYQFRRCNMAFIEPIHRNKPNITYLSAPCASVWYFNSAKRIHKDLGPVSSAASHQRDQSPCISRRLDHLCGLSGPQYSTYTTDNPAAANLGMDYKFEKSIS